MLVPPLSLGEFKSDPFDEENFPASDEATDNESDDDNDISFHGATIEEIFEKPSVNIWEPKGNN